ncbi:MAG: DUF2007 domain-containing protein [Gammaproteobacteria bacterium]|nr:DUF2007 domain-containing protein [Gammaproteobacteria bacterium]
MHVVYEAGNLIDAHLVRHALEHVGIPVFIRGEALLGGIGELPACGLVAVCVPESRWPEARALVEAWSLSTDVAPADVLQPWRGDAVLA